MRERERERERAGRKRDMYRRNVTNKYISLVLFIFGLFPTSFELESYSGEKFLQRKN